MNERVADLGAPGLLDVVHRRLDREPSRQFLLTGSGATR